MQWGIAPDAMVVGDVMVAGDGTFLWCMITFPIETEHSAHDGSSILLAIRKSREFNFKQKLKLKCF